jgi:hypothetical protein
MIFVKQWLLQTDHKINRAINKKYCRKFLEKHNIPQETTVRKIHVNECYYPTLGENPENVKDALILSTIDEIQMLVSDA